MIRVTIGDLDIREGIKHIHTDWYLYRSSIDVNGKELIASSIRNEIDKLSIVFDINPNTNDSYYAKAVVKLMYNTPSGVKTDYITKKTKLNVVFRDVYTVNVLSNKE